MAMPKVPFCGTHILYKGRGMMTYRLAIYPQMVTEAKKLFLLYLQFFSKFEMVSIFNYSKNMIGKKSIRSRKKNFYKLHSGNLDKKCTTLK